MSNARSIYGSQRNDDTIRMEQALSALLQPTDAEHAEREAQYRQERRLRYVRRYLRERAAR